MRRFRLVVGLLVILGFLAPPAATAHPERNHTPFPARLDLPNGFAPEGITTGRGTTVYVGSLEGAGLWRGDVRTARGTVLEPSVSTGTIVGIDHDRRRNLVWAAGGPTGEVRAYDARTGDLVATYDVEQPTGFLNDLAVTRHAVYVTDSNLQQLVVVPLPKRGGLPETGTAEVLELTGDLEYVEDAFNLNGIVAGQEYLVAVQSVTGDLFRIDPRSGDTEQIRLRNGPVTFGDGLELRGDTLYVVRNRLAQIAVVDLDDRLTEAAVVDTLDVPQADVPTTATLAAGRLWAVNARFGTEVTPETEYWISRVPLG